MNQGPGFLCATCLEAGIDVRTVAEWLGHRDHGALLLKTYSHVRSAHGREVVGKVKFRDKGDGGR